MASFLSSLSSPPSPRRPAAWTVSLLLLLLLPLEVLSQDLDLADALGNDDNPPLTPAPRPPIPEGDIGLDFDDTPKVVETTTTTTTKPPPKAPPKAPAAPKGTVKPKPKPAADEFDLSDALDPKNDIGGKDKNKGQGGAFSDSDLADVGKDDNYKPDKGRGGAAGGDRDQIDQYDDRSGETTAEIGTIAGIVSAVAMALVGAISSYISYQKKKLCFGLQQSLNTDMVKAENPEAVVATEPQVQQTLLEPPNAEPPTEENAV